MTVSIFHNQSHWCINLGMDNLKRVLAIFAHPDDEAFGPGGTLAVLAKTCEVNLICITDGGDERRADELLAAAKILGINKVEFLGYPDGHLNNAIYHQLARKIQSFVDEFNPDILLTFEPRGVSGHIDHVAVSMVCSYLFRENKQINEIWYYCELEHQVFRPFQDHYFIYFPRGYKKEEVDEVIDTSKVYATQVKAMMEHKTQRKDAVQLLAMRALLPKEECFLISRRK
jgi:LmbE family N-acetylglucosaminyl deacetylase